VFCLRFFFATFTLYLQNIFSMTFFQRKEQNEERIFSFPPIVKKLPRFWAQAELFHFHESDLQ